MIETTIFVTRCIPLDGYPQVAVWMGENQVLELIASLAKTLNVIQNGKSSGHIAVVFSGIVKEGDQISTGLLAEKGMLAL